MRAAVYCDLRYQRRDGALYCEESFARFAAGLADFTDRLVLIGRLAGDDAAPFAHRIRDDVDFLPLPDYSALVRTGAAALGMLRALPAAWRVLGTVDAVWLLGPHPFALACAGLAAARRRRVVLGVRENLLAYVPLRHRGRWPRAVARALDASWRAFARRAPVVVVGSELAQRYRHARTLLPIAVSLVDAPEPEVPARAYDGALTALAVGRLDPEKNPLLLADVLAGLRRDDPRWRLVVCGAGSQEAALRRRLDALGLGESAQLLGAVDAQRLKTLYATSHALLHVSWSEGVPQVLFEAWAAGLPVVATDVGGVGDAARDAALLIAPGTAGAAVRTLGAIAHDGELRRRLAAAGFERVRRHAAPIELGRVARLLAPAPPAGASPQHRHAWVWAVLAPDTRRVATYGDAQLTAVARAAGFEVVGARAGGDGAPVGLDAVLADAGDRGRRRIVRDAVAALGDAATIAVALGGGRARVPDVQTRAGRARELLAGHALAVIAMARARRLARRLEQCGLRVTSMATGERTRPYGLGPGGWRRRRRLPLGRVVVGTRGEPPPSFAEAAVAQASAALDAPLRRTGMSVSEGDKLMVDVLDPAGRPYIVRLAGGPARAPLERSADRLAELAAAAPGPVVAQRVPWPLARGAVAGASWTLERRAQGRPAARMTARLWRECLDLLVELYAFDREHASAGALDAISEQAASVGAHVDGPVADRLSRLAERLREQLGALPLGWVHGDFWSGNLVVRHGRVNVIVDWDWAARRSLPMLDLMDLIASSDRRSQRLRPGARLLRLLWPLARSGGDARMRDYCARTGTPADARTLEALAVAYWLAHVARDLLPFTARQRPAWLSDNVLVPLDELERARW